MSTIQHQKITVQEGLTFIEKGRDDLGNITIELEGQKLQFKLTEGNVKDRKYLLNYLKDYAKSRIGFKRGYLRDNHEVMQLVSSNQVTYQTAPITFSRNDSLERFETTDLGNIAIPYETLNNYRIFGRKAFNNAEGTKLELTKALSRYLNNVITDRDMDSNTPTYIFYE